MKVESGYLKWKTNTNVRRKPFLLYLEEAYHYSYELIMHASTAPLLA